MKNLPLPPRFKYRYELANEFMVSERTFRRMCKKANLDLPSGMLSPKEQHKIYQVFGWPGRGLAESPEVLKETKPR